MDPRRNVFFQYRGPSRGEDEFARDPQLENNVTKALVDLLYHTSSGTGQAALLSMLEAQPHTRVLAMRFRNRKLELGLQSVPPEAESAPHRAVMLITGAGPSPIREEQVSSGIGRPDAWVRASGDGSALLIEAKLGAVVSRRQIAGHLKAAGWPASVPVIKTSWGDWYNALRRIRSAQTLQPLDQFLLDQFLEYLEVIGMAPFTGFQAQDLDFFIRYEPKEYRPVLRRKLQQFAESVLEALDPNLRKRYSEIRMGYIHPDEERGAWVALRPAGHTNFPNCNFTIEITRDRLEFNAVIRDGRANDARKPIGILSQKLRADPLLFEEILRRLGRRYAITVFARTRPDGSTPPSRGNERWRSVATQRLAVVGEDVVRWLRFLVTAIPFPGIHVGRHIPRGDKLLQDPKRLKGEGALSFRALSNILEFLEG